MTLDDDDMRAIRALHRGERAHQPRQVARLGRLSLTQGVTMTHTPDIPRPDRRLVEALRAIGSATISGELRNLGIRNAAITGPRAFTTGSGRRPARP